MSEETKYGTHWQRDELDAIVSDYFAMLGADIAGRPYVKSEHNRALMAQLGRSHRSVEFKHQNISAVLDELGLPWIPGYRPKPNYQSAIFDAIDRYLSAAGATVEPAPVAPTASRPASEVFVAEPPVLLKDKALPERLRRLVRKFDPGERDHRNRSLGKAGEEFVVELERRRLTEAGRMDLARKIRWVASEDGDGAGYDVLSFEPAGQERLLEVKTTNGSARTPFFLSRNECDLAMERPDDWRIYRVHLFCKEPHIFTIAPPLDKAVVMRPETWRASFTSHS